MLHIYFYAAIIIKFNEHFLHASQNSEYFECINNLTFIQSQ